MQRWWNLSKTCDFGNFLAIILSPPFFCSGKNIFRNAVWEECAIPVSLGDNDKNLGESFFLTHKRICSNLNTINLKLLGNHGGIHRLRKKFKKDSGEIKHLGVHRNMVIGNWQYVCILFCWSWPDLRVEIIFRKERRAESGGGDYFEIVNIDTFPHLHNLIPFFRSPWGTKHMDFSNLRSTTF